MSSVEGVELDEEREIVSQPRLPANVTKESVSLRSTNSPFGLASLH